jgi:hypothetical protein
MRSKILPLACIVMASCSQPAEFVRDNLRDPGNPNYVPPSPLVVRVQRNERHIEFTWQLHPGGIDSLRFEKSFDGITFTTFGYASPSATKFQDTTRNLAFPMTYRVRSVYTQPDRIAISDPFDLPMPSPIDQVQPGTPVGSFSLDERLISGSIPRFRTLYGHRYRFTETSRSLIEYYPQASPAYLLYPLSSMETLSIYHNVFTGRSCPLTVQGVLEFYLPTTGSDILVAQYPLRGSPFTLNCSS